MPVQKNHGGVHAEHRKNTSELRDVVLPTPARVSIPMKMHLGAPCEPVVSVGDTVEVGQLIGDSKAAISAPIHASISGTVKKINQVPNPADGTFMTTIEIESDGEMRKWSGLKVPEINSREDFLAAVRNSGLVGLGGAGFPTHFKLNVKPGQVDTLVVNGAECEPYITSDDIVMRYYTDQIFTGIVSVMKWIEIPNCVIVVEDNKPEAIDALVAYIEGDSRLSGIKVMVVPAEYPKGAEKVLIQNATGRVVPVGKLPADVGCIVMNVTTLTVLGIYLKEGRPLTNKIATVDGGAIREPKNVKIPIGTSLKDIVDFCGGFKQEPTLLLMGGPMMGTPLSSLDFAFLKQNNAILALVEDDYILKPEIACIRCGRCIDVCPMLLSPTEMKSSIAAGNAEKTRDLGVNTCIECGCCAFACPSHIQLVQYFREGKKMVRALEVK